MKTATYRIIGIDEIDMFGRSLGFDYDPIEWGLGLLL